MTTGTMAVTLAAAFGLALAGCSSGETPQPGSGSGAVPVVSPVPTPPAGDPMKPSDTRETVILAGGCFWGMEELLRKIPGVLETEAGYSGGTLKNATYEDVKHGGTGHAESVRVVFDPAKLPFEDLLGWFFRIHDPTTLDRQGNDIGDSYRSAIFFTTEEQRATAERVKAAVDRSGKWKKPVVTQIAPTGEWSRAEEVHQDYLQKHPDGYTCHFLRD